MDDTHRDVACQQKDGRSGAECFNLGTLAALNSAAGAADASRGGLSGLSVLIDLVPADHPS